MTTSDTKSNNNSSNNMESSSERDLHHSSSIETSTADDNKTNEKFKGQSRFKRIKNIGKTVGQTATGFWASFHAFIDRGNVLDLAIALIVGSAFTAVVNSLVNDILTPLLSVVSGNTSLENKFHVLKSPTIVNGTTLVEANYATIADAAKAGAITLNYGKFSQTIINLAFVSFSLFLLLKLGQLIIRKKKAEKNTTECRFCMERVHIKATRCPHCTSNLNEGEIIDSTHSESSQAAAV